MSTHKLVVIALFVVGIVAGIACSNLAYEVQIRRIVPLDGFGIGLGLISGLSFLGAAIVVASTGNKEKSQDAP